MLKIKWLIANVTPVGSPAKVKHNILGMILGVFLSIQAAFVDREQLCDVKIPFCVLIHFLSRVIY